MGSNDTALAQHVLPWRAALIALAVVGSVFLVGYRWTNAMAQGNALPWRAETWFDHNVPFLPWTLLPYLSINVIYPLSFFLCANRIELAQFCKRLLAAQFTCFACFWLFPLHNERVFPPVDGFLGMLWKELQSFDMAGNLAPSLHAATLLVLWDLLRKNSIVAIPRWPLHAWFLLIAVSTQTTWQHYLFDLITGLGLGLGCVLLFPSVPRRQA